MKRLIAILLCVLLLAGCNAEKAPYTPTGNALQQEDKTTPSHTPDNAEPQEISLIYYPDRSMNPFQSKDYTNRALFSLIYQGLFAVDRDYQVRPILCDTYNVSADMKTYTFYLAKASFSDGTAVRAEDVVASLKASMSSTWYGSRLQHAKSMVAYGNAVVIELNTPMENLPILLDIPIVKASQVNAESPLGTGPYHLVGSRLRRQAGWWCTADLPVDVEEIPLVTAESSPQIRDSFEFGDIDLVCSNPGDINYVDFRSDYELWDSENGYFLYLVCNDKSKVFSNDGIRTALTHAINRDILADRYYHGFARSAVLPASPLSPYYSRSLAESFGYDPQKFRDAVEQAGLAETAVTILCTDDPIRVQVCAEIAKMLEAGGLTVTVTQTSTANFVTELKKRNYDLYLGQTKLSINMDLSAFFGTNTPLNYGGLNSPSLYALSLDALANSGNYYNLHKLIMEDGYLCPILFQNYAVYVRRGSITGLSPARDNLFYYHLGRTMADALMSDS